MTSSLLGLKTSKEFKEFTFDENLQSKLAGITKPIQTYVLNRNQYKAQALRKRNATLKECSIASNFWKWACLEQSLSKHQKKTAVQEYGRVRRIIRKKNNHSFSLKKNIISALERKQSECEIKFVQTRSLNSKINEKLFIDKKYEKTIDKESNTLEIISLYCSHTLDSELKYIADHFPNLKQLVLDHCDDLTDEGLMHVQKLHCLERLDLFFNCLSSPPKITDKGFSYLANLPLRYLDLDDFSNITNKTIAIFKNCPLEYLCIRNCEITDIGISYLLNFPKLKELSMEGSKNVTNKGLLILKQLPFLEDLALYGCEKLSNSLQRHFKTKDNVDVYSIKDFFSILDKES